MQETNIVAVPSEYCHSHYVETKIGYFRCNESATAQHHSYHPSPSAHDQVSFRTLPPSQTTQLPTREPCSVSPRTIFLPGPMRPIHLQESGNNAEATLAKIPQSPRKSGNLGDRWITVCDQFRKSRPRPILLEDWRTIHGPRHWTQPTQVSLLSPKTQKSSARKKKITAQG